MESNGCVKRTGKLPVIASGGRPPRPPAERRVGLDCQLRIRGTVALFFRQEYSAPKDIQDTPRGKSHESHQQGRWQGILAMIHILVMRDM